jgi:hypothetical protein
MRPLFGSGSAFTTFSVPVNSLHYLNRKAAEVSYNFFGKECEAKKLLNSVGAGGF